MIDTEYRKMVSGEIYLATDKYLIDILNKVKNLCQEYNNILPTEIRERNKKLHDILGECDDDTFVNQPFYCDYGKHIKVVK